MKGLPNLPSALVTVSNKPPDKVGWHQDDSAFVDGVYVVSVKLPGDLWQVRAGDLDMYGINRALQLSATDKDRDWAARLLANTVRRLAPKERMT
jgi:hypothetical protein